MSDLRPGSGLTPPEVSVVVPVLNEEQQIGPFLAAVRPRLHEAGVSHYEIVFVDDGSTDRTWALIQEEAGLRADVVGVRLNRNVGKEAALAAGLEHASGEAHIPMDVDLQDPPQLLGQMIGQWRAGSKMVLCRRSARADGRMKRLTAKPFYWLAEKGSGIHIPPEVGDFRVLDREISERYLRLPERNRFNKGLFALVAPHECSVVDFRRPAANGRKARQSWGRLVSLAIDGLVSFSVWPLRLLSILGFLMLLTSVLAAVASVILRALEVLEVPGQTTVILVGLFLAGIQSLSIGILGEYVGRILIETKGRPLYHVDRVIGPPSKRPDPQPVLDATQPGD